MSLRKHHYQQTSGSDGIPAELFQILKDDAVESAALNMQYAGSRHLLSDQYKEIEENKIMGKTRDLFKKIRDTKGIFHA